MAYNRGMAFIRKFKTASDSVGVQVCYKEHGKIVKTVHVGSAKSEKGIERLEKEARKIIDGDRRPLFNLARFDRPKEK